MKSAIRLFYLVLLIFIVLSTAFCAKVKTVAFEQDSDTNTSSDGDFFQDSEVDSDVDFESNGDAEPDSDGDELICECSAGECCDGCNFLGSDVRCSNDAHSYEYQCVSEDCGADAQRRGLFRYCSGASSECSDEFLQPGEWETIHECSDNQTCVFLEGSPSCHTCSEGCSEGNCLEPECTDGACCDGRNFLASTVRCSTTAESTECNCTSGECGANAQCREQHRYCTGASADCGTGNLQWEEWVVEEECSSDQICESDGISAGCTTCEYGCETGSCIVPDCSEGPCCDGMFFREATFECSAVDEYQCSSTECGADAQSRTIRQFCSGTSAECDGTIDEGSWETIEECSEDQVCNSTETSASCSGCASGCSEGTCDGIEMITLGYSHTCALIEPGNVRCWGRNNAGQLGYRHTRNIGTTGSFPSAAGNVDVGGTVIQISAGWYHTCALLDTGDVRCWGSGNSGRLGYGNTDNIGDNEHPSTAGDVDVGGTVTQISAGSLHTCALLDTGNVRCWGNGNFGRLGYGNIDWIGDDEAPSTAGDVDVGGTVIQIDARGEHTCALLDTGSVRCWGRNDQGQLGYNHTDFIGDDEAPSTAGDVDVGGTVVQISDATFRTCALLDTGNARCWGDGSSGRLGYSNIADIGDNEHPSFAGDIDVGGTVIQIAAGYKHTCALLDTGNARCWGWNNYGQLGYGDTVWIGDNEHPSSAGDIDVGGTVVQIEGGGDHTCAFLDTGAIRCWGLNDYGQLGYGNTENIGDNEPPSDAGDVPFR